jgi:hypothetical protein
MIGQPNLGMTVGTTPSHLFGFRLTCSVDPP